MTLDELKSEAAKILAIQPVANYAHHTFECRSGGAPTNQVGVPEAHWESQFRYDTVANGAAYSGSVTVECRDTGARDADGRTIYETPAGVVFVFAYRPGSPDRFDRGRLVPPNMTARRD